MLTYTDFLEAEDIPKFVMSAIQSYKNSDDYKMAVLADQYDAQMNPTVAQVIQTIYNLEGQKVKDPTATNHRIASNLFNRLNTQRCMYSLGNGISFVDPDEAAEGKADTTKEKLGPHFDHTIVEAGYHALIHGASYLFWDVDKTYEFKMTEFLPLEDEDTGAVMAGIRWWQLDTNKPMNAVLYEMDGFTKFRTDNGTLREVQPKRAYRLNYTYTDSGDVVAVDEENYTAFPVVRMYGSRLRQSTLVGMREAIDAYDLILSGFANDLFDCAQVYWLVENYGGMDENDLAQFLDRLKFHHIANIDTSSGGKVAPYTQEIPTESRRAFLSDMRDRIYEDFGALDVHTISAGATNDHIDAGYQPLDENADDFEHWVSDAIIQLLALQGIEDVPIFKRNRISNQKEQVDIVMAEAEYLDQATILRKLPNVTPEEVIAILNGQDEEDMARLGLDNPQVLQ